MSTTLHFDWCMHCRVEVDRSGICCVVTGMMFTDTEANQVRVEWFHAGELRVAWVSEDRLSNWVDK